MHGVQLEAVNRNVRERTQGMFAVDQTIILTSNMVDDALTAGMTAKLPTTAQMNWLIPYCKNISSLHHIDDNH